MNMAAPLMRCGAARSFTSSSATSVSTGSPPDGLLNRSQPLGTRSTRTAESIVQPGWSPEGRLYFISDRSGWWNLYRARDGRVESVCPKEADFGRPQWTLGTSTWAFAANGRMVLSYAQNGRWHLATMDLQSRALVPLAAGIEPGDSIAATGTHVVLLSGSTTEPDAVVKIDVERGSVETLPSPSSGKVDPRFISS